jgi:hypothetical protein
VPLSPKGLHGLLNACCAKATADGTTVLEVFDSINSGIYAPALQGSGMYEIESTSNAGQSVSQAINGNAPSKTDIADALLILGKLGADCIYVNPLITDGETGALCACIRAKLPFRDISSVRKHFHTVPPTL